MGLFSPPREERPPRRRRRHARQRARGGPGTGPLSDRGRGSRGRPRDRHGGAPEARAGVPGVRQALRRLRPAGARPTSAPPDATPGTRPCARGAPGTQAAAQVFQRLGAGFRGWRRFGSAPSGLRKCRELRFMMSVEWTQAFLTAWACLRR